MTVYGYIRVSTEEQMDGTSMAEQRRMIMGMAMTHGLSGPVLLEDGAVSGALPIFQRPAGSRLAALNKGDVVLVAKLDRFGRDLKDALQVTEQWEKAGVRMIISGYGDVLGEWAKSSTGRLVFEIMALFAGHERRVLKERQRDGQRSKRQAGGHIGGLAPFGYRKIGAGKSAKLEPDPHQQQAIRFIVEGRQAGKSLRALAAEVAESFKIDVTPPTVRAVLARQQGRAGA